MVIIEKNSTNSNNRNNSCTSNHQQISVFNLLLDSMIFAVIVFS